MEFPTVTICLEQQISRHKLREAKIHPYVVTQSKSEGDSVDAELMALSLNKTLNDLFADVMFAPVVSNATQW